MAFDRTQILLDTIKRLLRRGETARHRKIIAKTHAADLGVVFRSLTPPEQAALFGLIESVGYKAAYPQSSSYFLFFLDRYNMLCLMRR
jgi:magnesium transporter